jgi:hypothetical protein
MDGFTPCPLGEAESTEDLCMGAENATAHVQRQVGPRHHVLLRACPACAQAYEDREPTARQLERS